MADADPAPLRTDPAFQVMARAVLTHTIHNRHDEAGVVLGSLIDQYGPDGAVEAIVLWLDTLIANAVPDARGRAVALGFRNMASGELRSADDVSPETAWAGRLFAARIARDHGTFMALLQAPPPESFSGYFVNLLGVVALQYQTKGKP